MREVPDRGVMMGRIKYDVKKLTDSKIMDTSTVSLFFYDSSEYFSKLTEYLKNYSHYLTNYNPTVVVVSEDEKKMFIRDCANMRVILTQLGMTLALGELNNMENAVLAGEIKELDDGLTKFHATLEIYANVVEEAETGIINVKPAALLVTEDPATLRSLTSALEKKYVVISASSVNEVFELMENTVSFAVIFLAMETSGMSGYGLAFYILEHERFKQTPLFFLTESGMSDPIRDALPQLKSRYIRLPLPDRKKLITLVEEGLNDHADKKRHG
jgi:CheY-like chemotaxis protein